MQRLKRKPLSQLLGATLSSLRKPVQGLLGRLRLLALNPTTVVLIALILLASLIFSGCTPRTIKPSLPPQADPRPVPPYNGQTYRDVILYVIELRESALNCEADKAAVRAVFK